MAEKQIASMAIPRYTIFLALLLSFLVLNAQDSRVEEGIQQLEAGEFSEAYHSFDHALKYPAELSSGNLTRAYFFRALARVYYYNTLVMNNEATAISEREDSYLHSYRDLIKALESDSEGLWVNRIDKELRSLHDGLVHHAILFLNRANDMAEDPAEAKALYIEALGHAEAAIRIRESYLPHDIAGQALVSLGEDKEALDHFLASIRLYNEEENEPDLLMGYVYYRSALIYRYEMDNPDSALMLVSQGMKLVENEYEALLAGEDTPVEKLDKTFLGVMADLTSFELDLYMNNPAYIDRGLRRFREVLENNPSNYDLRISYASLLEKVDMKEAVEQYKKAIAIDSTRAIAYFNIGALYYSRGADQYNRATETDDMGKYELLTAGARENFLEAAPWFEMALRIEPGSHDAVSALKNISLLLSNDEMYEKYNAMEEKLKER